MTTTPFLYQTPILPPDFVFPQSFLSLARAEQPGLMPWQFLFHDMPRSLSYYGAMLQKYTDKPLIPFAIVDDKTGLYNGGFVVLACFDGDDKSGNPKVYFHDYSSAKRVEWADRYSLPSFSDWLRVAEEESAQFRADLEDEDD